jgi:hypothetical protein
MSGGVVAENWHLQTVDDQGATSPITLQVDQAGRSQVRIMAVTEGETLGPVTGGDMMNALVEVRRRLEERGLRLCCQAARINVWPSGQLRQFTDGRQGYVLTDTRRSNFEEPFEVVDLLEPAPASQVVFLDEQEQFIRAFYGAQ